jgi:hypothetical protein
MGRTFKIVLEKRDTRNNISISAVNLNNVCE